MIWKFATEVGEQVGEYKIARSSATIAYYTVFALAPTLFIFVALSSLVIGPNQAVEWLQTLLQNYLGNNGSLFLSNTLTSSSASSDVHSLLALAGILFLVYGVTSAFFAINQTFATIFNFDIAVGEDGALVKAVKNRLHSFLYLIGLFLILVIFTAINLVLSFLIDLLIYFVPQTIPTILGSIFSYIFSILVTTVLFCLIYRYASRWQVSWLSGVVAGLVSSILFSLVNFLFGLYVAYSAIIPLYGVSSFLVVFLLWIYYIVEISLLGAVIAKVYECRYPHHRRKVCL